MGDGTELGRVRGLGASGQGTHHWWHQRLTAGANLFLMLWFIASIAWLPGYDYSSIAAWLSSAWAAIPMALLVASLFYHARLGLQVAIEDYVHDEGAIVFVVLLNLFAIGGAAIGIFAVLSIAFSGASA